MARSKICEGPEAGATREGAHGSARPEARATDALTPNEASRSLDGWGFLVQPDLPDRPGPAFLLVALREQPELTHYDPEAVEYWTMHGARGRRALLSHASPMPLDREFSWGTIRLVDRVQASNEYLTFGGRLSAACIERAVVSVFLSGAPIVRRGGHSQGWDAAAENIAVFFARAKVAVDYVPGFEARFGDATPVARYSAFVDDLIERYRVGRILREAYPGLWRIARAEEARIGRESPVDRLVGAALLQEIRSSETAIGAPRAGRRDLARAPAAAVLRR